MISNKLFILRTQLKDELINITHLSNLQPSDRLPLRSPDLLLHSSASANLIQSMQNPAVLHCATVMRNT